ncbi:RNA 2',3'-cyclic phosphodiesterase [Candidatus Woesearchaeota archaeon]|nr:RNA 2',3'-cyclic phosphodiesterase [Candidatus Woesearchaeota archaeon]
MRLFIAIEIPGEIKDYLFSIKNNFKNDIAKVNWVAKKNIHLTLKFLSDVDEKLIKEIINKLNEVKFNKFDLELDKLGFFPNEDYIKVMWAGVKDPVKVMELQQDIEENLSNYFKKENEFSAHITIGRVKFIKKKKEFLEISKKIKIEKMSFKVTNFKLIKSELSKDGPKYTLIEEFKS